MKKVGILLLTGLLAFSPLKDAKAVTFLELMVLIGARDAIINGGRELVNGISDGTLLKKGYMAWKTWRLDKRLADRHSQKSLFEAALPDHADKGVCLLFKTVVEFLEQDPRTINVEGTYHGKRRIWPPTDEELLRKNRETEEKTKEENQKDGKQNQPQRFLQDIETPDTHPESGTNAYITFNTEESQFSVTLYSEEEDCERLCATTLGLIKRRNKALMKKGADQVQLCLQRIKQLVDYQLPENTGDAAAFKKIIMGKLEKWLSRGKLHYAEINGKKFGIFDKAILFELESEALTEAPSYTSIIEEHLQELEEEASITDSPPPSTTGSAEVDIEMRETREGTRQTHHLHLTGALDVDETRTSRSPTRRSRTAYLAAPETGSMDAIGATGALPRSPIRRNGANRSSLRPPTSSSQVNTISTAPSHEADATPSAFSAIASAPFLSARPTRRCHMIGKK